MTNDPRLKKIEDYINPDQRSICSSNANYIIMEGVAGSRKTDTMVRLGLRRHLRENKNILFLTQVGSVTDEICSRVGDYLNKVVYRQASSNHHLAISRGKTIEVANFDAWIHKQLHDQDWKHLTTMGSYHGFKARCLMELENFKGFCLKNGEYADEILIDECQDFDAVKAELIVSLLEKKPNVRAVFCGDYMQTIFEKSLENKKHPISIFATLPSCQRFYMQKCYRCPAGHIAFCNQILKEALETYNCKPLLPTNQDHDSKPFLFTHGSTSKRYDVGLLVGQLCQMVETLMSHDRDLKPSDFCFMMRKSNNQPVFEALRISLENLWTTHGHKNSVIHFMTQYDGYRNSIQWNHAIGKTCLISIHGDKGKGHKVVFFIGLTQKSIPDECAMHKENELLFHSLLNVALTRSTKYLFVGFHYAQPSVYLTRLGETMLEKYAYTSWTKNHHLLFDNLASHSRFPKPDFVKFYRKMPLNIPTLNMLSIVEISRRFERPEDIFGFNPKVEIVKFGSRVRFQLSDDIYPILSRMCELILMKELDHDLFVKDIEWFPKDVYFTDDERLLSWAHDFRLSKWVHSGMHGQQMELMMDTYRSVIESDDSLKKALEHIKSSHQYVMHSCFNTPRFHKNVLAFLENKENIQGWWDLSLLFHELQNHHQKIFRYMDIDLPRSSFQRLLANIKSFITFLSKDILFRPCHDILANISNPEELVGLGFEPNLDERYFENGYHYGILGNSGILDTTHKSLYDIKVSPIDFSMEWFMQTSFHANLPTKRTQNPPEKLVVVNLMTGRMHTWKNTFQHPRKLLKRLMSVYSFPEPLFDNLYRMNHHRFKRFGI
jgi:hypothetical protein